MGMRVIKFVLASLVLGVVMGIGIIVLLISWQFVLSLIGTFIAFVLCLYFFVELVPWSYKELFGEKS